MGKYRQPEQPSVVQGLSAGKAMQAQAPQTFVDDFTGETLPMRAVGAALPKVPQGKPKSGDQLHQLAQAQVQAQADLVLQQAGLAPKAPRALTLSEAVQRATVLHQLKQGTRR